MCLQGFFDASVLGILEFVDAERNWSSGGPSSLKEITMSPSNKMTISITCIPSSHLTQLQLSSHLLHSYY